MLTPDAHTHNWKIAIANGPTSTGTCNCGEVKEFQNSVQGGNFDSNVFLFSSNRDKSNLLPIRDNF